MYFFRKVLDIKVHAPPRLVSQVYKVIISRLKYKDQIPDVSCSDQNIDTPYNAKQHLTELNDLFFKNAEKTSQEHKQR